MKAAAAGHKNVEQLKNDADLDALCDRQDFKSLIADLENK